MEEIYLCNVKIHQNVQKSLLKVVHPKIDLDLLSRLERRQAYRHVSKHQKSAIDELPTKVWTPRTPKGITEVAISTTTCRFRCRFSSGN